jgi:hypothetical protein
MVNDGVSSSVGIISPFPTEWKNKKCSKPPTSILMMFINHHLSTKDLLDLSQPGKSSLVALGKSSSQ